MKIVCSYLRKSEKEGTFEDTEVDPSWIRKYVTDFRLFSRKDPQHQRHCGLLDATPPSGEVCGADFFPGDGVTVQLSAGPLFRERLSLPV